MLLGRGGVFGAMGIGHGAVSESDPVSPEPDPVS